MQASSSTATVNNEWDKLTKVFVGIPKHPVNPEVEYVLEEYEGLSDEVRKLWRKNVGKPYDELVPDLWDEVAEQEENLVKALKGEGVEVARPEVLNDTQREMYPIGNWQMYPRDPMLAVGPYIIDLFCRVPFRRKEVWGTRKAITQHVSKSGQRHVSMPQPPYGVDHGSEAYPYLEGGDIFVLNKDILVGHSGLASSHAGIEWLTRFLEPDGYRVHTIELTKEWLHLDCIFATPREGLFLCTPGGLVNGLKEGLPKFLHDWEMIETTKEEAKRLGCNGFNLEPGVTVIGSEHERVIDELDKKGVKCIILPYDKMSMNGGGPRCSVHPLQRVSG